MIVKIAALVNGAAGVVLAFPIVRYLLSPSRQQNDESWLSLGSVGRFPSGQTRLASFRNPIANEWDGKTADVACWVRHDSGRYQVFAINCAHLGCPVRWFSQSGLFLCPCHGGAYYSDGSRASGPPERGLFEYPSKIENDALFIKAGAMPTPGASAAIGSSRPPCA
jgi:Rieske Fe-S protein